MGIELDIGILFAKEGADTLIHAEQYDSAVLMQYVVLYGFVFPFRMVVIENDFRLFVLEELQGNEREAFVCHEHIDTAEGAFQPCQFAEGLFQIGSEGEGLRELAVAQRVEHRKRKSIRTETDG